MKNKAQRRQAVLDCRIARRMHDRMIAGQKEEHDQLVWRLRSLEEDVNRLRGLQGSSYSRLRQQVRYLAPQLIEQLTNIQRSAQERHASLSFRDLVTELRQVRADFGAWEYHHRDHSISVNTEDIELDGQYLGPFEIRLKLDAIGYPDPARPYSVIAIDPHPASGNEGVTHPHVTDNHLCEGDATLAIRNALRDGRLCDFFTVINQVLNTYNPGSAYVALDQWSGTQCSDCDYIMASGDACSCERCDGEFCSECIRTCQICDRSVCQGCSSICEECGHRACSSCSATCEKCNKTFCDSCLESGRCQACRDEEEREKDHEDNHAEAAAG